MKFLSIDVETTGLAIPESQILQVAAVGYEDGKPELTFQVVVSPHQRISGEAFALQLNQKLLQQIAKGDCSPQSKAIAEFSMFVSQFRGGDKKVTVAGKNAAGFDIPMLRANGFDVSQFNHRVIDPGSLWLPDFGYVPTLSEINARLGRPAVSHDALDDARDVVAAVTAKLIVKKEEAA